MFTRPICFFDLETTSADPKTARIVEISILKWYPDGKEETKTKLINPTIPIPKEASEIHNIWDVDVEKEPTFKQLAKGILDFITDCDICGYNSNNFDVPILYSEFHRAGLTWDYSGVRFFDPGNIFKRKEERTLTAAYKYFCDKDLEGAHGAEADVKATKEVFFAQLNKYEDLPENEEELAKYCNFDKDRVDIGGIFSIDGDGDYVFNIGKHKGRKAKTEKDYLWWMMGQDFLPDVKEIIKKIVN